MAIIEEIPGLEVRILVDRRPLQEYPQTPDESDDSEQQATRYIVAEPGKEFKVEVVRKQTFRMGAPKWDVTCWTKIDGKEVRGSFIRKTDPEYITKVMDSVDVDMGKGKWGSRKFMFSELAFGKSSTYRYDDIMRFKLICTRQHRSRSLLHKAGRRTQSHGRDQDYLQARHSRCVSTTVNVRRSKLQSHWQGARESSKRQSYVSHGWSG